MITIVATISLFASFGLAQGVWNGWSDGWDISESHSCESTGYEYGNWSHSDHFAVTESEPDEKWTYANSTDWDVVDNSAWYPGNYTFEINTTDINSSFAVLNNSGMNRSQVFGWIHVNYTETDAIAPFLIFAYENATSFDCVMWSSLEAWICHWNGTNMTDIDTGDAVVDPSTDAEDLSNQWIQEGVYLTDTGNFYKYIYNELEGRLQFKWWDGATPMYEPAGWCINTSHTNITHGDCRGQGIGVWNYDNVSARVQYDLLNYWQLNYTLNTSAGTYWNVNGTNESFRPHMDFPVIDLADWTDEIMSYFNNSEPGNLTMDDVRMVMKDNVTNLMNLESRSFTLESVGNGQQNDTVYYYACALDNFTAFFEGSYDDWLHLHVQMCPEDDIETGEYGDIIIGIDVDNNRAWDTNDRFYWAYANDTFGVTFYTYNGDGFSKENIANASIWHTNRTAPANLHRYGPHLNYALNIPFVDLIKNDSSQLNSTDIFGLCIMTTTSGSSWGEACIWNNWNETSGKNVCNGNATEMLRVFFNLTSEEEWLVNGTCIAGWGEGEIGSGLTLNEESGANVNITKTADVTEYTVKGGISFSVNYSIWVNNTGSGALTTVVVNDTLFNCSCNTWSESDFKSNIPWTNITNGSCYRLFDNDSIGEGESWHIWYTMNLTICDEDDETGTITNNAIINATELDTEKKDSYSIPWNTKTNIDNAVDLISGDFLAMFVLIAIVGMMVIFLTGALKIR